MKILYTLPTFPSPYPPPPNLPPPRSRSLYGRVVGLGSEVKGRDIGAARAARDWSCFLEQHSSHDPGVQVGVHYSRMESRSRALTEKDKGGEAGLAADGVASGNKPGKKVNISLALGSF